jgi:hypothetical protein
MIQSCGKHLRAQEFIIAFIVFRQNGPFWYVDPIEKKFHYFLYTFWEKIYSLCFVS